jgi:hypothetical protein
MEKEESLLEKGLYFLTALVINLILFTLLSTYLLFARLSYEVSRDQLPYFWKKRPF